MYTTVDSKQVSLDETATGSAADPQATANDQPAMSDKGKGVALLASFSDLLPFTLSFVLLCVVAWPMITWWYWEFTRPESYYAHAPLIPLMSAFMLWHERARLKAVSKQPFLPALLLLVPSLVLLVVSVKGEMRSVESSSFLLTIWASLLLALGPKFFKAAWFPLLFLSLMAPLPAPLLNDSTLHLQMWSTDLASKILAISGFGNTQIGNVIHIDNFTLDVDVPCSGFKTLLALLTFNGFLAFMLDGPLIRRILLFVICSPLALLINGVRIALIGMVGECFGSYDAHVFHDYSGIITLMLGFILLFSIARSLGCRKFAGWDIF